MGYTTEFEGQFRFTPQIAAETILRLMDLEQADRRDFEGDTTGMPDSYNQWVVSKDRQHLQWDGGEKFYFYVEWLQYLIDYVLAPVRATLSGTVAYAGEEVRDTGVLTILDGQAVKIPHVHGSETLEELRAFHAFMLAHPDDSVSEALAAWRHAQTKETTHA